VKHLSWVVTLPLTIVAVVFAVANREDMVLRFWPLPWSFDLPVYLVVLGSLVAGFLAGGLVAWIAAAPRRRRARRTAERARELAHEVSELRRKADQLASTTRSDGQTSRSPFASADPGREALEHLPGA
jgi:uncharacterized integral membrane protein